MSRKCADCRHLVRTSAGQEFLRCCYWGGHNVTRELVPEEWRAYFTAYVELHCHMQPEATACPAFRPREVRKCSSATRTVAE